MNKFIVVKFSVLEFLRGNFAKIWQIINIRSLIFKELYCGDEIIQIKRKCVNL